MERVKESDHVYENQPQRSIVRTITYGSMMMALVFIATYSVRIPIPFTQGYIHPGDSMIFVASLLFGWQFGALVGGFGSAFADILGGYAHWAFPTLIIKGIMGALVGWVGFDLAKAKKGLRVQALLTAGAAVLWVAFCLAVRTMLANALHAAPSSLLAEVTETGTMVELTGLAQRVDFWLTLAAVGLPLSMLLLAYYLRKRQGDLPEIPQLLGMLVAGLWMVAGYYIAGGILYGSFIVSIFSIPANILQFLGGLVIAYPIVRALKKARIPERL